VIVTHDIHAAMVVSDQVLMLGRDRRSDGSVVPGARIQATHDLVALGLAWRKDLTSDPRFLDLARALKGAFKRL
jgi:ABC-type nitrate/sulfonate/bicarbonate transport system ATPase subunit